MHWTDWVVVAFLALGPLIAVVLINAALIVGLLLTHM